MLRVYPSPILFYFYFFIQSELVRVDPSWSDADWRSELIRSDFCTCLLIILAEDQNWKLHILHKCIHQHGPTKISLRPKVYSKLETPVSLICDDFFFLEKNFWIHNSMLTLSFIHNFGPKKISRKQWTEKQKHSQENYPVHLLQGSNFQAKKHPPQKALCAKI